MDLTFEDPAPGEQIPMSSRPLAVITIPLDSLTPQQQDHLEQALYGLTESDQRVSMTRYMEWTLKTKNTAAPVPTITELLVPSEEVEEEDDGR